MAASRECVIVENNNSLLNTAAFLRVPTPLLKTNPEAYIPQFISFGPYHNSTLEKDIDSPCAENKIATAAVLKGKYVDRLSQKLATYGKSFDYVVQMMKDLSPKIESFYHCPTWTKYKYFESSYHCPTRTEHKNSENFARMMARDSSFLLQFLIDKIFTVHMPQPTDDEMVSLCTFYSECINYDMIKMENQIPLFVLKEIFEYAKVALPLQDFNELLERSRYTPFPDFTDELLERSRYTPFPDFDVLLERNRCTGFPTFDVLLEISRNNLYPDLDIGGDEITREPHYLGDEITRQPHYLGYAHASHSILLKTQAVGGEDQAREIATLQKLKQKLNGIREELAKWIGRFIGGLESESGLFSNGISAVQLARAGIKFKAFSNGIYKIQLDDIISGTVYLPRIVVCDVGTEVFLRNMLALEFNDAFRPKYVTSYVALMGILVQSPEDVRMLVDRHIISPGHITLTDEGMVKLWNDVRQPFLGVTAAQDELYSALREWYEQHYWIHLKIKVKRKVSGLIDYMSSWRFIAPLAGFLGLVMTAIQTYCSVYH